MVAAAHPVPPDPATTDHFVYLRNVSWEGYEHLLSLRGDGSNPRISYLKGVVELMSPSRFYETDKTKFARLLEAWAEERGLVLEGYGSWTLKSEREERGAEPDECYMLNRVAESDDDRPDLAVEVVWTSGGIDKLEIYRKLGVREVWYYERGSLRFFELAGDRYAEIPVSVLLPDVNVALLLRCMDEPTQTAAVQMLRAALRT